MFSSPQNKSLAKRIVGIEVEFASTRDGSCAAHFRNNSVVGTKLRDFDRRDGHHAADDAFDGYALVEAQFPFCIVNRCARAYARTRARAINLSIGKDAHVAAVASGFERRTNKDSSIQKTQIRFEGMGDRKR